MAINKIEEWGALETLKFHSACYRVQSALQQL